MSAKEVIMKNLSDKDEVKVGVTAIFKGKDASKSKALDRAVPKVLFSYLPVVGGILIGGLVYWTVKSGFGKRKEKKGSQTEITLTKKTEIEDRLIETSSKDYQIEECNSSGAIAKKGNNKNE